MKTPECPDWLFEDSVAGALERRKHFLGNENMSKEEENLKRGFICSVSATEAHAIDRITAHSLFRERLPGRQGVKGLIAKATSLTVKGIVVYRLPDGDWLEPLNEHWIPACFPWAQWLERLWKYGVEKPAKEEKPAPVPTKSVSDSVAKVLHSRR